MTSSFVIESWLRYWLLLLVAVLLLWLTVLSLRAEVADNLLGQACVFGWTHASVDACSLTLSLPDDAVDVA